jgi:hypothetical protein
MARERSDEAIQTKRPRDPLVWVASSLRSLAMTAAISQVENILRRYGLSIPRKSTRNPLRCFRIETVEGDPSFRMAERVSPLTACQ